MTKEEFLQSLKISGFPEPVLVEQPANGSLDLHTHDFEVRALVVAGSIQINCEGNQRDFQVGDEFHLQHKEAHTEHYGINGVKYLASRKLM